MATLHLVGHAPGTSRALEQCLARAAEGDAVLLMADGVYGAVAGSAWAEQLEAEGERLAVYVLAPDLAARGLDPSRLVAGVGTVDYRTFVSLAVAHHPIQSWF
ncbi:sulfurtransferase complex subunit TusB [Candidatus Methylocalor cossyra]|uniref:tRNA 2-thiouridine synthesizing protein B n=1 Tax=Candidatus Methylocalor cossyra TaxID=3108543 RepID=A0ABM9NLC4_9GAMM